MLLLLQNACVVYLIIDSSLVLLHVVIMNVYLSLQLWYHRRNPCFPSPCGLYSLCHVVSEHPVCSCQAGHVGSPPPCRPECIVSTDCPQEKACVNQKCLDPCPAICGLNASCQVVNHSCICTCSVGFIGDPFVRCIKDESKHCLSSAFNFVNICLPNVYAVS